MAKLFELSGNQRRQLALLYKQERDRLVAQRLQAILLLDCGKSAKEVGEILFVSPKTIKRWIKIYVALGLDALRTLKHDEKGVAPLLQVAQLQQLEKDLDSQIYCSAKEVMNYIEQEFGVKYSESGVLKILKKLNYSYKKPAVVPAKADFDRQVEFVGIYEGKKRV